jgi:hypothetical protein
MPEKPVPFANTDEFYIALGLFYGAEPNSQSTARRGKPREQNQPSKLTRVARG